MKKLDRLIIQSFIPPFIMAFFIALFVLVMQFLWKFIDDIVGKGLTMFDIGELLMYRSISLFPLALPIGVLLASVLVFGNMSEQYELSSLKSAGVSLIRILKPAIIFSFLMAAFSFYCNNTLNPVAILKFQARLYDIRMQKPALSISENIFNEDFKGFSIRVGEKAVDNRHIKNVLIYDNSPRTKGHINLVSAKSGEMYYTDDSQFFVMELYDGEQYQEVNTSPGQKGFPFMRTKFKRWRKEFDMSAFDLGQTDEELFKTHYMMKSVGQLADEVDSLKMKYDKAKEGNLHEFGGIINVGIIHRSDTLMSIDRNNKERIGSPYDTNMINAIAKETKQDASDLEAIPDPPIKISRAPKINTDNIPLFKILKRAEEEDIRPEHYSQLFMPSDIKNYAQRAKQNAKTVLSSSERTQRIMDNIEMNKRKHIYELHSKFSLAFICIIFIFIGGPMGAIVRKGGYGYPLLIAIFFFTLFIILNIMCKKLNDTASLDPVIAAWLPCILLAPVGIYLTVKAMNDSKLIDIDKYIRPLTNYFKKLTSKSELSLDS